MNALAGAFVRPARQEDLGDLLQMASKAGVGLTTLPNQPDLLAARIEASRAALQLAVSVPGDESYLFVLQAQGRVVACSALIAAVGTQQAFYNYHVGRSVFASRELKVYRSIPTLYLSNDLTGASELATLFVDPDWRGTGAGQLISLCRFLFIAAQRWRFGHRVIAELRGVADDQGRSPFWDSLGRQFFAMDFSAADQLSGAETRAFIAELMPRHPVYTVLLSEAAQKVIGCVHEQTRAARRLLEREGFRYRDYVDIFDAGPALEAETDAIFSVRVARRLCVEIGEPGEQAVEAILANQSGEGFRALRAQVLIDGRTARLSRDDALSLQLDRGDQVLARVLG